jgi:hypothetical protein
LATIRCVGATVLADAIGEIEKVSHVFHPAGRFSAANSPYPFRQLCVLPFRANHSGVNE